MYPKLRQLLGALLLGTGTLYCTAQEPYTVGRYLHDRAIGYQVDSAEDAGNSELALRLHRTMVPSTPWHHFRLAELAWQAGGSYEQELRTAFALGFFHTMSDDPRPFEVAASPLLSILMEQAQAQLDPERISRCMALIDREQVLASGPGWDSLAHRANVDSLNVLIAEGGWPSSYALSGHSVSIALAHQHWDQAKQFEPYQSLIEAECKAGREDRNVALLTLQQRIRWTARNQTDTISFQSLELQDDDPALPMIVAISERMGSNGSKQLWLHTAQPAIASAIADRIIGAQPRDETPAWIMEMLKAKNYDRPAPVTLERISFVIDPTIKPEVFLYRMD